MRLFGTQAVLAGRETVDVIVPQTVTAEVLKNLLATSAPGLATTLPGSRIAIDHEYAAPDDPVPPGAEVALIGLVSGG